MRGTEKSEKGETKIEDGERGVALLSSTGVLCGWLCYPLTERLVDL